MEIEDLYRIVENTNEDDFVIPDFYKEVSAQHLQQYLINLLCKNLDDGQNYFEFGMHKGGTFVPATLGLKEKGKTSYGVDAFVSEFGGLAVKDVLENNLKRFGATNYEIYARDGNEFLVSPPAHLFQNIDVYYFDGGHSYDDTVKGLMLADSILKDEALILVDDVFIRKHSNDYVNEDPYNACVWVDNNSGGQFSLFKFFPKNALMTMKFKRKRFNFT